MSRTNHYKNRIINSNPLPLINNNFSSNGNIEDHNYTHVKDQKPPQLQSQEFLTEEEADEYYVQGARDLIDKGIC